jgi:hypothetical protein
MRVESGTGVEQLLCHTIGLSPEYVEQRIQTIFLDGQPVDDLSLTTLKEGSRVALSAAMPGVAGAMMRRDGFFAGMRSGISYRGEEAPSIEKPCFVTVKVFNMLVKEIAPQLMKSGLWLTGKDLVDLLERLPTDSIVPPNAGKTIQPDQQTFVTFKEVS